MGLEAEVGREEEGTGLARRGPVGRRWHRAEVSWGRPRGAGLSFFSLFFSSISFPIPI
jgi:hypothetical protein